MSTAPPVSVITRTLGKPVFLRRVLASLAAAAPEGTQWVIVDDSGEATDALADTVAAARAHPNLTPVLVTSASHHRAIAMNAGLAAATGATIHILDDDDTIHPDFYVQTRAALAAHPEAGAVAVRCDMVEETFAGEATGFRELRRTPHFPEIEAISIAMMLVQQITPTCSVLFRAETMRSIGPFNTDLAVCEDYEFFLRFLLSYDMVKLNASLAAFHTRVAQSTGGYENSDSSRNHAQVDTQFRNAMLRRALRDPADKLGSLLLMGDLARGAVKIDRASVLLRKSTVWQRFYRLLRRG